MLIADYPSTPGPSGATPRAITEQEFLRHTGLDVSNPTDRIAFDLMREETQAGRARLIERSGSDEISEAMFREEVLQIYVQARPETLAIYNRGLVTNADSSVLDNWVIRYLLWEAIRSQQP